MESIKTFILIQSKKKLISSEEQIDSFRQQ